MIKKVKVQELQLGMYVHDLNCGWIEHPFMRNRFLLKAADDIDRIAKLGLREIYIDTERGMDARDAPTREEVRRELGAKLRRIAESGANLPKSVELHAEMGRAREVLGEANRIVRATLIDARMGKQAKVEQLQGFASSIADSVLRNPDAILGLARIKQADQYTFQHCVAVGTLLIAFCTAMRMDRATVEQAGMGGLLHDIGKMRIPSEILNKPGKLTAEEFDIMKAHAEKGRLMLLRTPGISPVALSVAAQHHERADGSGYPLGLKGPAISLHGQMAAIVDVYDALTSDRVYHKAEEPTEVLHKLLEWSEAHFEGPLVQRFVRVIGIYPVGTLVQLESGRLAVVVSQRREDLLHPKVRVVYDAVAKTPLAPEDLDLSRPGVADGIRSFASAAAWKIDPIRYL